MGYTQIVSTSRDHRPFDFDAGSLCLDFCNTWGDRPDGPGDRLRDPEDLYRWGAEAGLVSGDERRSDAPERQDGRNVFDRAIGLRESIHAACGALAAGRVPRRRDLEAVNTVLRETIPNLELGIRGNGCCWEWSATSSVIDRILGPVARSTADLLTSDAVSRIRECAGDGCSWLFLDVSRNRSRKWCSMSSCGNRAKARRHYARKTTG